MSGHTFVSYSRHQYYFAESLTLHLQQRGLPVWFDLQQIEPGVNWRVDIQNGLDHCDSVTLVASRAALRSPNVAREWQAALDAGKPIYIALYERVRLPAVLRQRGVIIDFRRDFQRGADILEECLTATPGEGPTPGQWRGRQQSGLTTGVRRMALALALSDLTLVSGALLELVALALLGTPGALPRVILDIVYPQNAAEIAKLAVLGLLIMTIARLVSNHRQWRKTGRFLRHHFEYDLLQKQLEVRFTPARTLWSLGMLGLSYAVFQTDFVGRAGSLADNGIVGIPLLLGLMIGLALLLLVRFPIRWLTPVAPDPDVIRWADLGSVPQAWRIGVNRPLITAAQAVGEESLPVEILLQQSGRPGRVSEAQASSDTAAQSISAATDLTVRVVAASADQEIAGKITRVLSSIGFYEVLPAENAAHIVLVLTYRTPVELALDTYRAAVAAGVSVIGVMATNVTLLPDLLSLQIIDFRDGSTLELTSAFRYLRDQSQAARAMFSQQLLPARLTRQVPDRALQGYFAKLVGLASIIVAACLWDVVRLALSGRSIGLVDPGGEPVMGLVLVLAGLALPLFWQAIGVLVGQAHFSALLVRLIALAALPIMVTAELLGRFAEQMPASVGQSEAEPNLIGIALFVYLLLLLSLRSTPVLTRARDHTLGMRPLGPQWIPTLVRDLWRLRSS